jgi:hypothetical protein
LSAGTAAAPSHLQPYRALGFHVDTPWSEWPAVDRAALVVVIGDRQRSGARKLLRRFLGRSRLREALAKLSGRFVVLACSHGRVIAQDATDIVELLELHREVFSVSRLVRGHVEVIHALDPRTRAAVIEDGKRFSLAAAPIGGRA